MVAYSSSVDCHKSLRIRIFLILSDGDAGGVRLYYLVRRGVRDLLTAALGKSV